MRTYFFRLSMRAASVLLPVAGLALSAAPARASGPVERLVQLLAHPADPNVLVVRYALASQGYLYSQDGGKTFRAMCSQSVAPDLQGADRITKLSFRSIPATAANVIDSQGRVTFALYGSMWMADDASGCGWSRVSDFDDKWAFSLKTDPRDAGVVWAAVNTVSADPSAAPSRVELFRRDAAGTWTNVGSILPLAADEAVFDGDLLATTSNGQTRLYVTVNVGGLRGYKQHVLVSDDDGKTWRDTVLPASFDSLNLLAVDPADPNRLLGALTHDAEPDELFLSEDQGKTFKKYGELRAISGYTFDATGRLFLADGGDGSDNETNGGLFTAAKLGQPLTKLEGTSYMDCVHHHPQTDKLYACNSDRFGEVDPLTGAFKELVRVETVPDLIACPGRNMYAECETQFNDGPSWCCAGHFPFTPFCAKYDVTETPAGRRVYCGISGRIYDDPVRAAAESDAGTPPTGGTSPDGGPLPRTSGDPVPSGGAAGPSRSQSGGCAVDASAASGGSLGALLAAFGLILLGRRRSRDVG